MWADVIALGLGLAVWAVWRIAKGSGKDTHDRDV